MKRAIWLSVLFLACNGHGESFLFPPNALDVSQSKPNLPVGATIPVKFKGCLLVCATTNNKVPHHEYFIPEGAKASHQEVHEFCSPCDHGETQACPMGSLITVNNGVLSGAQILSVTCTTATAAEADNNCYKESLHGCYPIATPVNPSSPSCDQGMSGGAGRYGSCNNATHVKNDCCS